MTFKRFLPSAVLAVGVTCGLALAMKYMIAAEFTPQDKAKSLTLDINPMPDELPPPPDKIKLQKLKRVETPPPPPMIERAVTSKPTEVIADLKGDIPNFDPPKIDRKDFVITVSDADAAPIVRIAPIMPPRAEKSGHCNVRFNVSAEGAPYDVVATYCTQSLFERATIKSVQKWKFKPKMLNGRAVAMRGVMNKVTYRLTDERGNIIPE